MSLLLVIIVAAILGSFANMLIYRLPRDLDIVWRPSFCPKCEHPLTWQNLLPILSYLGQLGRCSYCRGTIPARYFLTEILTTGYALWLYLQFGMNILSIIAFIYGFILIIITFTDFETQLIPDQLSLGGLAMGLMVSLYINSWPNALLGACVGGGVIYLIGFVGTLIAKKEAMGGGDVKLAAMIGVFVGWQNTLVMLFLSFIIGSIMGLTAMLVFKFKRTDYIPFGPAIAIAGFIAYYWGPAIWLWYW